MIVNKWILLAINILTLILVQLSGVDWTTFGLSADTAKQLVMILVLVKSFFAVIMPPVSQRKFVATGEKFITHT